MDKSTEQIIRQIAEIQLEAIEVAKKEHLTGIQLKRLCGESITNDVDMVINRLTDAYKQVIDYPRSIGMLPVYQLNLCCSILTENYKTWELDNSEGVYGAFELLSNLLVKMGMENKTVNLQTLSKNLETVMIPAKSSNVVAFGYNQKTETIWVLFKGNALYAYKGSKDLPLYDTFIEGINAESKGKWANSSLVNNKQLSIEAYEIK